MAGGVGHMDGLTNPRPRRGRCRAGYSNTGGPPLPQKRTPFPKNRLINKSNTAGWLKIILTGYVLVYIAFDMLFTTTGIH